MSQGDYLPDAQGRTIAGTLGVGAGVVLGRVISATFINEWAAIG